jgi:hypothetical protein
VGLWCSKNGARLGIWRQPNRAAEGRSCDRWRVPVPVGRTARRCVSASFIAMSVWFARRWVLAGIKVGGDLRLSFHGPACWE